MHGAHDDFPGLEVGGRVARLALPAVTGEARVPLRGDTRDADVILFVPAGEPPDGQTYWREFTAHAGEFRGWDGRPLAVVVHRDDAPRAGVPFPVLVDEAGEARARFGVDEGEAALFVADRWGIVYLAARATGLDGLPPAAEIVEQLKFLATQCPECGVHDMPQEIERWSPP